MNNNEKLFFIYFHNSCTRNGDHLILLIETGNARKERMAHKLSLLLLKSVRRSFEIQLQMMVAAKW